MIREMMTAVVMPGSLPSRRESVKTRAPHRE
jgi:hypothetical protein